MGWKRNGRLGATTSGRDAAVAGAIAKAASFACASGVAAMLAGAAEAAPFSITTTGVITSGSDPAGLFGLGTNLIGDAYILSIQYSGLGAGYFTDGGGGFALDEGDSITGVVTATVSGHTISTALLFNTGASLTEDNSDVADSNSGNDAAGNFAYGSQNVSSANNFVSFADLQTPVNYTLGANDSGLDSYSFSNAANTKTVGFSGATTSVALQVPEPSSWAILGVGMLAVGWSVGRRRRD